MPVSTGGRRSLGLPRVHLRVTDSTNERARELALAGAPDGTLVTAAEQSAGRGRQGRRWSAPAGSSILMSLVVRSPPRLLPLMAAARSPGAPATAAQRVPGAPLLQGPLGRLIQTPLERTQQLGEHRLELGRPAAHRGRRQRRRGLARSAAGAAQLGG